MCAEAGAQCVENVGTGVVLGEPQPSKVRQVGRIEDRRGRPPRSRSYRVSARNPATFGVRGESSESPVGQFTLHANVLGPGAVGVGGCVLVESVGVGEPRRVLVRVRLDPRSRA